METNLRLLSQYKYTYTSNMFTDLTMSIETKWSKLVRQIKDDDKEDNPDVDITDEPVSKSENEETMEHMAELSRNEVCIY